MPNLFLQMSHLLIFFSRETRKLLAKFLSIDVNVILKQSLRTSFSGPFFLWSCAVGAGTCLITIQAVWAGKSYLCTYMFLPGLQRLQLIIPVCRWKTMLFLAVLLALLLRNEHPSIVEQENILEVPTGLMEGKTCPRTGPKPLSSISAEWRYKQRKFNPLAATQHPWPKKVWIPHWNTRKCSRADLVCGGDLVETLHHHILPRENVHHLTTEQFVLCCLSHPPNKYIETN